MKRDLMQEYVIEAHTEFYGDWMDLSLKALKVVNGCNV